MTIESSTASVIDSRSKYALEPAVSDVSQSNSRAAFSGSRARSAATSSAIASSSWRITRVGARAASAVEGSPKFFFVKLSHQGRHGPRCRDEDASAAAHQTRNDGAEYVAVGDDEFCIAREELRLVENETDDGDTSGACSSTRCRERREGDEATVGAT